MNRQEVKVRRSYKEQGLRQVWHVVLLPEFWGVPLLLTTRKSDARKCYDIAKVEYADSEVVMFCRYMKVDEDFCISYGDMVATRIRVFDPAFDDIDELFL